MKFAFDVGDAEKVRIEFKRDPFFGQMTITANGEVVAYRDPMMPSTHFNTDLVKRYTFVVGTQERHEVTIEHERPRFFAGFRPQTYRVIVDGRLKKVHEGF